MDSKRLSDEELLNILLYDDIPSDVDSNIDSDDDNNEDFSNTDNIPIIFDTSLPDTIIDDDGQRTSPATVQPLEDNIAAPSSSGTVQPSLSQPSTIQPTETTSTASTPSVRNRIPPQWSTNFDTSTISDSVFDQESGPTERITNLVSPSPYDLFKTLIDDEIIDSL